MKSNIHPARQALSSYLPIPPFLSLYFKQVKSFPGLNYHAFGHGVSGAVGSDSYVCDTVINCSA